MDLDAASVDLFARHPSLSSYDLCLSLSLPLPAVYTEEQLQAVRIVARKPTTASDKVSLFLVKALRKGFDFASFYKHKPLPQGHESMTLQELRNKSCFMTPDQWLTVRPAFLSPSTAPVADPRDSRCPAHRVPRDDCRHTRHGEPRDLQGLDLASSVLTCSHLHQVGGAIRHLQSLRLLRRDGGWIHTLLSEAENERSESDFFLYSAALWPLTSRLALSASPHLHAAQKSQALVPCSRPRLPRVGASLISPLGQTDRKRRLTSSPSSVFYNLFFLTYLLSPRMAHRFVACLEEEAVRT